MKKVLQCSFDLEKRPNGIDGLFANLNVSPDKISLIKNIKNIDPIDLDVDYVVPIGLITNELITNALNRDYVLGFCDESQKCPSERLAGRAIKTGAPEVFEGANMVTIMVSIKNR